MAQGSLRTKYGEWAVVTGASDGIGREIAILLAQAGLNLVLVARRQSVLEELAADLSGKWGIETRILAADLSRAESVEAVVAATETLEIGLLIASAGFGTSGRLIDGNLSQELEMIDVNVRAVLALSYHFGRYFASRGRGGVVLLSSLVAFQGVPQAANYAATKAYVQSLAEALHVELAPLGVDVVASAPGPVASGFARRADMQMNLALKPEVVAQGTLNALGRTTTVRPGFLSKFLEAALMFLPRWARVRMMGQIMGGMTKHQTGGLQASHHGSA
jgi:hypothetical protein